MRHTDNRSRAGFTMAEMLTAAAILAVLLAVAAPGIVTARQNLKFTELENTARQIFIAAQNRLTVLRAAGRAESLGGAAMPSVPEDFPAGEVWSSDDYRYVTEDTAGELLPAGTVDETVRNADYVIEYNRKTGMVYGVFYAEGPFMYQSVYRLRTPEERGERKSYDPMLGYYGGAGTAAESAGQSEQPEAFELVNGDTLYVRIKPTQASLASGSAVRYTLTLTGAESGATKRYAFDSSDTIGVSLSAPGVSWDEADGSYRILLDSLEEGEQFQTLYPGFTPGEDITAELETVSGTLLPAVAEARDNSLFARRSGGEVTVANGRQLQNLSAGFSGVEETVNQAVQSGGIQWESEREFQPIENAALLSFDGGGQVIADLRVEGAAASGAAGLFGTFAGSADAPKTIGNVRLEDPAVENTASQGPSGTLAGRLSYVTVENCQSYASGAASDSGLTAAGSAGGLVGYGENCTLTGSSASLPVITVTSGNAGGLVGEMTGGSITGCYADTGVRSGSGEAWEKGLSAESGSAGGLVGQMQGGAASDSYALGWLNSGGGAAAGFAGSADGSASFTGCYAAAEFGAEAVSYGFSNGGTAVSCYYLAASEPVNRNEAQEKNYGELGTVFSGDWIRIGEGATAPYGCTGAYPFLARSGLTHYGDWPEERQADAVLAYYERYADGTYGYFWTPADGGAALSSLREGFDVSAAEDGYAFLVPASAAPGTLTVRYSENAGEGTETAVSLSAAETDAVLGGTAYASYLLRPGEAVMQNAKSYQNSVYDKLGTGEQTFWVLPDFAETAVQSGDTPPAAPDRLVVRTARHLAALAGDSGFWGSAVSQELDVDFTSYSGVSDLALTPIGNKNKPFLGTYDGGGHTVTTGVGITSGGDYAGLFGYVGLDAGNERAGTVKNLIFRSGGTGTAVISGGSYAGALAGYNEGLILNCAAAGFAVSGTGSAGGLVGYNEGVISACAADNAAFDGALGGSVTAVGTYSNGSKGFLGGFVGQNKGMITGSYAVSSLLRAEESNLYLGGFAGASEAANADPQTAQILSGLFGAQFQDGGIENCYCVSAQGETWPSFAELANESPSNCLAFDGTNKTALAGFPGGSFSAASRADAARTFPYSGALMGKAYPFPTPVTRDGAPVHYGNWPDT